MTQTRNDTSVATLERCACGHRRLAHQLDGVAPACNGERCHCPAFRLGEAPVDLNAMDAPTAKPGPLNVAAIKPSPAPVEEQVASVDPEPAHRGVGEEVDDSRTASNVGELIREGKTSAVTETVTLAAKLEQLAADLHRRLDQEAEQRRLLEEIRGLEEKLTAARARLAPAPARPKTPDSAEAGCEAASGQGCPDCAQVFTTARGLGRHRAWAHDYRSPSHHPTSAGVACPDCGKELTTAGLALHRIRAHGYRKQTAS